MPFKVIASLGLLAFVSFNVIAVLGRRSETLDTSTMQLLLVGSFFALVATVYIAMSIDKLRAELRAVQKLSPPK